MPQPRLCLLTQTPLVRFQRDARLASEDAPLSAYREGVDYLPSPGGVTRMVGALLARLQDQGRIGDAAWIALSSAGPRAVKVRPRLRFHQVRLGAAERAAYAAAKAAVWEAIHGLRPEPGDIDGTHERLDLLARAMRARVEELHGARPFDAFYVHDFQLLPMARHLPADVPRVFRWHIPVPPLAGALRDYVARQLSAYDAIVVSTAEYAARLELAGVRAPVHAAYPYLDEGRHRVVTSADVEAFEARWGLEPDDVVFLVVARLDPMKSQDVALRALARIAREAPRAKLVLVGGGGFSAGRNGLGLPHAVAWRSQLVKLARELGVAERVILTGGLPDADVDVAFTRARAVLLPSLVEGFGLAPVEGWLYGRPALVSRGAGVAELVEEDENGFTHAPGDDAALAAQLRRLATDADMADRLGARGRETARACHLREGSGAVWRILSGAMEARAHRRLPRETRRP